MLKCILCDNNNLINIFQLFDKRIHWLVNKITVLHNCSSTWWEMTPEMPSLIKGIYVITARYKDERLNHHGWSNKHIQASQEGLLSKISSLKEKIRHVFALQLSVSECECPASSTALWFLPYCNHVATFAESVLPQHVYACEHLSYNSSHVQR